MKTLIVGAYLFLALATHASGGIAFAAAQDTLRVPEDNSLTTEEYVGLGVPDPRRHWTANDYFQALRVLSRIEPTRLPRARSSRSQLLFDRLLITYGRFPDLEWEEGRRIEPEEAAQLLDPPRLYARDRTSGLLFDKELVAIRSEALESTLTKVSTRSELFALSERYARLVEISESEAERMRMSAGIRSLEHTVQVTARLVKQQAIDLLVIAGIPEVRDSARHQMLLRAEALFPELREFLPDSDLRFLGDLIRGAAGADLNSSIRSGLLKLADELEAAAASPAER